MSLYVLGWISNRPLVVSIKDRSEYFFKQHFLGLLMSARGCKATDCRDKIFSLFQIMSDGGSRDIANLQADYTLSPTQVFTNVALFLLNSGLDFLSSVQGKSSLPGLPSWIPDWSMPPKRQELILDKYYVGRVMHIKCNAQGSRDTGKTVQATPVFLENSSPRLKVFGISLGDIKTLGEPCGLDSANWTASLTAWDTLAAKSRNPGINFCHRFERLEYFDPENIRKRVPLARSLDIWLGEERRKDILDKAIICGRSFFVTSEGYFGIGPAEMQVGDLIYTLCGGPVPYVIRESGDGNHVLVGRVCCSLCHGWRIYEQ